MLQAPLRYAYYVSVMMMILCHIDIVIDIIEELLHDDTLDNIYAIDIRYVDIIGMPP